MKNAPKCLQENCTQIVPTFCSASLIKNDHDEQQLLILTEFGYKDINGRNLPVKLSIFGMLTGKNNQQS